MWQPPSLGQGEPSPALSCRGWAFALKAPRWLERPGGDRFGYPPEAAAAEDGDNNSQLVKNGNPSGKVGQQVYASHLLRASLHRVKELLPRFSGGSWELKWRSHILSTAGPS